MPPWRDCRCVIALSRLPSWLSSSRCPLFGMSSPGCPHCPLSNFYKYIRILPCHRFLSYNFPRQTGRPTDRQRNRNHAGPFTTPTYFSKSARPLTKANYHNTQWPSATHLHTSARATSAHSQCTLRRGMPKTPHHAATHTSPALVTTGLVDFRAMPSTSITSNLMGQLSDPARTRV